MVCLPRRSWTEHSLRFHTLTQLITTLPQWVNPFLSVRRKSIQIIPTPQTTPSKDSDARWIKKNGLYKLGYKQHTRTDEEGYIEKLHITPANAHECKHLSPLLEGITEGTAVYADKGYDSAENRQHLEDHQLLDGIMRKACRNRPLSEAQTKRNRYLSKTRYVVEQSFGTLHRKFRYARAAYFGLIKVSAQSHLKAMCLNLLKAANRLSVSALVTRS